MKEALEAARCAMKANRDNGDRKDIPGLLKCKPVDGSQRDARGQHDPCRLIRLFFLEQAAGIPHEVADAITQMKKEGKTPPE